MTDRHADFCPRSDANLTFLDNLLGPEDAPWHLSGANDINNRGDIVGNGTPNGERNSGSSAENHPFLLKRRGL